MGHYLWWWMGWHWCWGGLQAAWNGVNHTNIWYHIKSKNYCFEHFENSDHCQDVTVCLLRVIFRNALQCFFSIKYLQALKDTADVMHKSECLSERTVFIYTHTHAQWVNFINIDEWKECLNDLWGKGIHSVNLQRERKTQILPFVIYV